MYEFILFHWGNHLTCISFKYLLYNQQLKEYNILLDYSSKYYVKHPYANKHIKKLLLKTYIFGNPNISYVLPLKQEFVELKVIITHIGGDRITPFWRKNGVTRPESQSWNQNCKETGGKQGRRRTRSRKKKKNGTKTVLEGKT